MSAPEAGPWGVAAVQEAQGVDALAGGEQLQPLVAPQDAEGNDGQQRSVDPGEHRGEDHPEAVRAAVAAPLRLHLEPVRARPALWERPNVCTVADEQGLHVCMIAENAQMSASFRLFIVFRVSNTK